MKRLMALPVLFVVALCSVGVASVRVDASPFPLSPSTDPRDPGNCPGGYGTGPDGEVSWCRFRGVNVVPASGVGHRWAGSYAILVDGEVFYGWCLNDAGTHPRVDYPTGTMQDAMTLVATLHGAPAHPDQAGAVPVAMGLINDGALDAPMAVPGSSTTYSADVLSAAVWAIQHYVVGDRSSDGRVVVPDLAGWSNDEQVDAATAELFAYALGQQHLSMSVAHDDVDASGNLTFVVDQRSDAGPLAAAITEAVVVSVSNLTWQTAGLVVAGTSISAGSAPADTTITDGRIELRMTLIDPTLPGRIEVSRRWAESRSWQGFPASGGQQDSAIYMSSFQEDHRATDEAPPSSFEMRLSKAFDNPDFTGSPAGYAFRLTGPLRGPTGADLTTGAGGSTKSFAAVDGAEYCVTEVHNPDQLRTTTAAPFCFAASSGTPVVTVTNHLRPASVSGVKIDDRGHPVVGASFSLQCASGVAGTTTSDEAGVWAFADVSTASGVLPTSCTITETAAPTGIVPSGGPVAAFELDAGDHLDLREAPLVNRWDRRFGSMTSTPVARPADAVEEFAYARNLAPGEVVSVTGRAFWLGAGQGSPVDRDAPPAASFGPWTITGAGSAEVVAGVSWTLPPDRECGGYQVVLTFTAADGSPLGEEGWDSPDQQIAVPCVRTETAAKVVVGGAPISDAGVVEGLPSAASSTLVRATVSLPLIRHRGDCVDGEQVATGAVAVDHDGPFTTEPLAVATEGFAYTVMEALTVVVERANAPAGWSTPLPGTTGAGSSHTVTTSPDGCDPDETVLTVAAQTAISGPATAGAELTDSIELFGLPSGTDEHPAVVEDDGVVWGHWRFAAVATGAVHRWPTAAAPDCSGAPLATFGPVPLRANGRHPGLGAYVPTLADAGHSLGYVATVTVSVTNVITGVTQHVVVTGECGDIAESVVLPPPPTTTVPAHVVPTSPAGPLPRTGGTTDLAAHLGTALLVGGTGLIGTIRRRRRASADEWPL